MVSEDPAVLPPFLQLAGHELRWQLLRELAYSDRRVRELVAVTGQPQNLVSYHLGKLRAAGLVMTQRSSADGRDIYYHLDLRSCGELLASTAAALHPALGYDPAPASASASASGSGSALASGSGSASASGSALTSGSASAGIVAKRPVRVLFLCTGNSARSPMAAALLQHRGGRRVVATSAGSHPKALNPNAVRVLRDYGIDLSGHRPQHVDAYTSRRFDYVISLCDRVREVCPEFPHHPATIHWSIPDPAAAGSGGSGPAGSGPAGSGPAGSGPAGSGLAGSGLAGSGSVGSGLAGSGSAGSGSVGSGLAGSGAASSGTAGSGSATGSAATNAGRDSAVLQAFRRTVDDLDTRIRYLLPLLTRTPA